MTMMMKLLGAAFFILQSSFFISCDDFFKQESNDVLYANQEHLNNAVDTAYSVVGILGKLQTIADRTILLGEVRGDLVDLTLRANSDLRDLANFCVGDDNRYNQPSDYYAVINNCNYYVEHADTALRSRNEPVFMAEYAAVKSIRAWTYLQLALNYGRVPLFTEPLLSREAAEAAEKGATAGIEEICSFFLNDLANLPTRYNTDYPLDHNYVTITGVSNTELLFFPLSLIRGELYLWRASVTGSVSDYREAALQYFQFISERNGQNEAYATTIERNMWQAGTTVFNYPSNGLKRSYNDAPITIIPGNSTPAYGAYSELNDLFCSNSENNFQVSIEPSQRAFDISEAQDYCLPSTNGKSFSFAPKGLSEYKSGDLRLYDNYYEDSEYDPYTEERIRTKYVRKHSSTNVTIYRRTMVYLHLAEALNGAGYPRMAFLILSEGLSNKKIMSDVMPYYMTDDRSDSLYLAQFNFDDKIYEVADVNDFIGSVPHDNYQMGIHSRGSGWTPGNTSYQFLDSVMIDSVNVAVPIAKQQAYVDSLLLNEEALELAFEGTRYYDIMRFALRQDNPAAFMAKHILARRGEENRGELQGEVKTDFTDRSTWFLHWNGKIGF